MFSDLPDDIILHTCRWLSQGEVLSLALTTSHNYELIHAKLFEVVVVDSSRRMFDDVFDEKMSHRWYFSDAFPCNPTVIRSLYGLKMFFKYLLKNPHRGRCVRQLVVKNEFPDMPELELARWLRLVLPTMDNLHVLNWYALHQPLDAKLVKLLPHPEYLESLCGNFQYTASSLPSSSFYCLGRLDLSNVSSCKDLLDIDMADFPNLDSFTLAKGASSNMLQFSSRLTNCCQSALSTSAESLRFSDPPSYISCLFSSVHSTKIQLSSLTLKDISVSAKDAYTLLEAIEIPNLRKMSLDNCAEALFDTTYNDIPFRRRTPPSQLFLDVLSKHLTHLESLNLNLSNELCYNRITFRAVSTLLPLKHLGIHIKMFKCDDAINLAPLVDSIQPHSNSLEYLNLCCDVVDSSVSVCPKKNNRYSLKSVIGLSNLRKLKVLKLPLSFSQISNVANVLCPLTNLHIIQFGITDVPCSPPKTACDPCDNTAAYGLYSDSCLISQEYFNCPASFISNAEQNKTQEYLNFSKKFRSIFKLLQYIRFDMRNQSLLYDCENSSNIVAKDAGLVDSFDSLVNRHICDRKKKFDY